MPRNGRMHRFRSGLGLQAKHQSAAGKSLYCLLQSVRNRSTFLAVKIIEKRTPMKAQQQPTTAPHVWDTRQTADLRLQTVRAAYSGLLVLLLDEPGPRNQSSNTPCRKPPEPEGYSITFNPPAPESILFFFSMLHQSYTYIAELRY